MKIIGIIVTTAALLVLCPLLEALAMRALWDMFLAHRGSGLSLGEWYGAALLARVALSSLVRGDRSKDKDQNFSDSFLESISIMCGLWLSVGVAWMIGYALGWLV